MVIAVPVAALLLLAAGCGGSSSSSEGDSTATIESADTTAADTTGGTDTSGTETSGTDTSGSDDASLEGCTKLTDLSVKFSEALGAASSGSGAPDLEATAKAYEEFADQVPEEIRDAFRTVAAAFSTYAEVLKDVDLSSGETPDPETLQKFADAAKALDNTELTTASAEIEAWAKKNCSAGG
jgi:hypothetical protein